MVLPKLPVLNDLLALCHVPRWAIVPMVRPQSVGEHSYRVALIALELAGRLQLSTDVQAYCLVWGLVHDVEESWTGDIPGHVKRLMGDPDIGYRMPPPPLQVLTIVKIADLIETYTFARKNQGSSLHASRAADYVARRLQEVTSTMPEAGPVAADIVHHILNETGRE